MSECIHVKIFLYACITTTALHIEMNMSRVKGKKGFKIRERERVIERERGTGVGGGEKIT